MLPRVISYAHGAHAQPLLGETIGQNLERTAAVHPHREAIVSCHQNRRMTYAEFDAEVDAVARALLAAGMRTGDRIGIWSPNRIEWALVQYATAKVGIVLVNINPAYRTHELVYALQQSGCRMLIAASRTRVSDYEAMTAEARDELTSLEQAVFFDAQTWEELGAGCGDVDPERVRAIGADAEGQARGCILAGSNGDFGKDARATSNSYDFEL